MLTLVSYDIHSTKKRNKIAKILEQYGHRVQFSVFECDLQEPQRRELFNELEGIMKQNYDSFDSVRFYRLCSRCTDQVRIIGAGSLQLQVPFVIF